MNKTLILTAGIVIGITAVLAIFLFSGMNPAARPADADDHAGEADAEEGHEEHAEGELHLDDDQLAAFGVTLAEATGGIIETSLRLTGEIRVNENAVAHVVPRVPGVAQSIAAGLGDPVRAGQVLAVLSSRELAAIKSAYLSSLERFKLAEQNYRREEGLWKQKVTAEQDYLSARNELAEAEIARREAEESLHALGFNEAAVRALAAQQDHAIARYELVAPISGVVSFRHITLGELVRDDGAAFMITDLSSVWLELDIYQRDLPSVRAGAPVEVTTAQGTTVNGRIAFIDPSIDEETRTARARVVLDNRDGSLRPGQFVTANLAGEATPAAVVVPVTALVQLEAGPAVFVREGEILRARAVTIGRRGAERVEITDGLAAGEQYVAVGGFTLKSELAKESFGHGHSH
jgi:cobalt-zinc-cadmium efflux system membrane fusion protein